MDCFVYRQTHTMKVGKDSFLHYLGPAHPAIYVQIPAFTPYSMESLFILPIYCCYSPLFMLHPPLPNYNLFYWFTFLLTSYPTYQLDITDRMGHYMASLSLSVFNSEVTSSFFPLLPVNYLSSSLLFSQLGNLHPLSSLVFCLP